MVELRVRLLVQIMEQERKFNVERSNTVQNNNGRAHITRILMNKSVHITNLPEALGTFNYVLQCI